MAQEEYEQQQAEQAENEASESDDNSNGPGSDDPSLDSGTEDTEVTSSEDDIEKEVTMEHNYMNEPKPTNRIIEMILGITGSIFGIIGGLIALILTNYDKSYGSELVGLMTIVATSSIILSAITLTLSCLINKRRVLIGIILIVAIIHIYLLGFFGYLSGILILVAGIIALVRNNLIE